MIKTLISVGVGLSMLVIPLAASAQTAPTDNSALIAVLQQLIVILTQELQQLIAAKGGSTAITAQQTGSPTQQQPAFTASPTSGVAPLTVEFMFLYNAGATGITFGDGQEQSFSAPGCPPNNAGGMVNQSCVFDHTYASPGTYKVQLLRQNLVQGADTVLGTATITVTGSNSTGSSTTSSITVTYPNGGEQIAYDTGKDVDFGTTWTTSSNYSNMVYVYLVSTSGSQCLIGSVPSGKDYFPMTIGSNFQCQNGQQFPGAGQYKVEVSGDDGLGDGKEASSMSGGFFTLYDSGNNFTGGKGTLVALIDQSSLTASTNGKTAAAVTITGTASNVNQVTVTVKGQNPAYASVVSGHWSATIGNVYPNSYTVQVIDNDSGANNGSILTTGTLTVQ
jgi:hypothetical protein